MGRRLKSACHERCKRCKFDETIVCPILDKVRASDCEVCMWLPREKVFEVLRNGGADTPQEFICPYNEGIECNWATSDDIFMDRPVRGHCICCDWCPADAQKENSRHFGEWVKSKLGIADGELWPIRNKRKELKNGN